jgi:hypothetical protein
LIKKNNFIRYLLQDMGAAEESKITEKQVLSDFLSVIEHCVSKDAFPSTGVLISL